MPDLLIGWKREYPNPAIPLIISLVLDIFAYIFLRLAW